MGKVAGLGSDWAIVTSDNPRTEDPLKIMAEIEDGIRETGRPRPGRLCGCGGRGGYVVIPDRREAITQTSPPVPGMSS